MFLKYLCADFKKTKNLSIRIAHIGIPIGIAAVFLIYYAYSPWDTYIKAAAYYQVLGMGVPFLIGIFCAMLSEQELSAGAFQSMLAVPKRPTAFFSKLLLLILFGMGAVLLASVLFGTGYFFFMRQQYIKYSFYWDVAFVLMGSNIFLYVLHLFLALRFNKCVTICFGIVESLLSALLLTGMGDPIWVFVPAAWASRFATLLLQEFSTYDIIATDWKIALFICIITTAGGLLAFFVWACHWDGTRGNE